MKALFKYISIATICIATLSQCGKQHKYIYNEGYIFGTTYHIKYNSNEDYHNDIISLLNNFNNSLSTYNKESTISKINRNEEVALDSLFIKCFNSAQEISRITNGTFDLTVAPIVNLWGFGFTEKKSNAISKEQIDSIMQYIGHEKIKIVDNKIQKEHPKIMLDASAIAKGYGVDIACEYLISKGIRDFMVEIGGEVRVSGKNDKRQLWKIGIDKPIEAPIATSRELQSIVSLKNKSMATSGNYRQYYEVDGIKYSHTINPLTGYPARNTLLSASVIANNCMTADAFATAFMVMGLEKSKALSEGLNNIDVYLIYSDSTNNLNVYCSNNIKKFINE